MLVTFVPSSVSGYGITQSDCVAVITRTHDQYHTVKVVKLLPNHPYYSDRDDYIGDVFPVLKRYCIPYHQFIFKGLSSCLQLSDNENLVSESNPTDQATLQGNSVTFSTLDDSEAEDLPSWLDPSISSSIGESLLSSTTVPTLTQSNQFDLQLVSSRLSEPSRQQESQPLSSPQTDQARVSGLQELYSTLTAASVPSSRFMTDYLMPHSILATSPRTPNTE